MSKIDYDFSGLLIGTSLDLYGLRSCSNGAGRVPDIRINLNVGMMPPRHPVTHAWKGRFQLTLEGGGGAGWTIRYRDNVAIECDSRGSTLDCICRDPAHQLVLTEILSRRVLPRLSTLHGRLPIHAASLANDDGAVLILGSSGVGKSTLTAAMATAGWDIMSDDMSILSGPDDPHVWQTAPGVSLWHPSRCGLDLSEEQCRPIEGYHGKYWFAPPQMPGRAPAPVRAILCLVRDQGVEQIGWRRMAGPEAIMTVAGQIVRFDPSDRDDGARLLALLTQLVAGVPCYRLTYPRHYAALPQVMDTIVTIQADAPR